MTYDQMDPEIRAQILSKSSVQVVSPQLIATPGNTQVILNESTIQFINIATCRGPDGSYLAFIVGRGGLMTALSNPEALASEPRQSRSAALASLLEATEERIKSMMWRSSSKETPTVKKGVQSLPVLPPKELPETTAPIRDYGEKPKEKSFWKKHTNKLDSHYAMHV